MEDPEGKFRYVYSSDLDLKVQIKIGTLEGKREKPEYDKLLEDPMLKFSGMYQSNCSDLCVHCQVYVDGKPLALPVMTSYKPFTSRWNWNEWVSLPLLYSDLPRNAVLALTIFDCGGPSRLIPVGGTTVSLFGKHGVFRQGILDLQVWPGRSADGGNVTTTPGKGQGEGKEKMHRLSKLTKKYRNGHMTKVDWLDRLTFREIEMINERQKRESEFMYLMIEFPVVEFDGTEYCVIYYEKDGDEPNHFRSEAEIVCVPDFEIMKDNLVESKHHKLARCLRSGVSDKDLKPDASTRDQLNTIVAYPPTKQLTVEEQDLVWKFRFYLSNQKKALAKFLKCVNWHVPTEARQALDLLQKWAPMDVEDALELLGPNFTHPLVRRYAVTRLKQAPDEDLLLYLLQLAQALKWEDFEEIKSGWLQTQSLKESAPILQTQTSCSGASESGRTERSSSVGSSVGEATNGNNTASVMQVQVEAGPSLIEGAEVTSESVQKESDISTSDSRLIDPLAAGSCDLATFLIHRACNNSLLANYFYWYLLIECEDHESAVLNQDSQVREMYLTVLKRFSKVLQRGGREWQLRRTFLNRQQTFIDKLVLLVKTVARESGNRKKKIERLQALLFDSDAFKFNFASFEPLPFPLDPEVSIKGIIPEEANLFKSAMMPCRLTFLTTQGTKYIAIFKHGDDLRQDQLILQIITLMDKLLRKENLDLKLTPYRVLATSSKHGFVQFVTSTPVAEVLSADGSIQNFFRKHNPSESGPYGIQAEVMDTYVKSCAGYCVITYLLGVGDRHLDNLLLTKSGKMFHIDFGYILGRDPKPMPPPMKLTKEMVDAMGGINSEYYQEFRKQCYTAFLHLRRHSNLILNLFSLMVDASVPDIALEPDKTVKKVQDKFQLHLSDEEAVHYMQNIIDLSASDMVAVLVEQLHKFAQYWRK